MHTRTYMCTYTCIHTDKRATTTPVVTYMYTYGQTYDKQTLFHIHTNPIHLHAKQQKTIHAYIHSRKINAYTHTQVSINIQICKHTYIYTRQNTYMHQCEHVYPFSVWCTGISFPANLTRIFGINLQEAQYRPRAATVSREMSFFDSPEPSLSTSPSLGRSTSLINDQL